MYEKNIDEKNHPRKKTLLQFLVYCCPALSCSHLANPSLKKLLHWQLLVFARKLASMHCIPLNTLTLHFPNFIQSQITLTVFAILKDHYTRGLQTVTHRPDLAHCLFLYCPRATRGFYTFMWLKHTRRMFLGQ